MRTLIVDVTAGLFAVALVGGCAGSRPSASDVGAAAVGPAADLSGKWHGSFGQVAASLYEDESKGVLQINPDGTFMATVTGGLGTTTSPSPRPGQGWSWQNSQGPWPWIILRRSGDHTLYGVATDPAIGAPVMIKFERDGSAR